MSISQTRQLLVEVARQLFAKNGLANTTMNDIAVASGKGRRTLYVYFKSKEEVYYAVIETELERLSDKLDEVAAKKIRPQDKIIELIYKRYFYTSYILIAYCLYKYFKFFFLRIVERNILFCCIFIYILS